jgi:hypothetical protein
MRCVKCGTNDLGWAYRPQESPARMVACVACSKPPKPVRTEDRPVRKRQGKRT